MSRSALLVFALLPVLAAAESPMDAAKKYNEAYKRAMLKKDMAFFEKTTTPDFVYVDVQGRTMKRADSLAAVKQGFQMTQKTDKMDARVVSAKATKEGVVFRTDISMAATLVGSNPMKMTSVMSDETLLVKRNGRWLCKRVKMLKDDTRINGKPFRG